MTETKRPEMLQLGYFGNIWIRQHHYEKAGDSHQGHKHLFDHVTLLATGSVKCEVEGHEPKEFKAPTFIIIKKDKMHKFTALEDNTTYYCIFALRDIDGDVTDVYLGDNSPYGHVDDVVHNKERWNQLLATTQQLCPGCTGCNFCGEDEFEKDERKIGDVTLVKL